MDNKNGIIVAAVIVILVAAGAGAAFFVSKDGNDDKKEAFETTSRLLVYGNANNDNYLDYKDVDLVRKIIDERLKWQLHYPYADANRDGRVDNADITVIQNFIAGKPGTMYYRDWNDSVSSVPYPLTGKIAALYDSTLWITQILGVSGDVTHMFRTTKWISGLSTTMFPEAATITAFGGFPKNVSTEAVLNSGVNIILGDPWAYSEEWIATIEGDPGTNISVVKLPENREIYGMNWSNSVVTLGVMMNIQSKTAPYIEYIENVETKIGETVKNFTATEKNKTFIILYLQPDQTGTYVDVYSKGAAQYGDICTIDDLPLKCAMEPQTSGYFETTVEAVMALDADIIFFSTWGPFSNNYTEAQYKELVATAAESYKTTRAYKNGDIYAFAYEVYGTLPGVSGLIYLASKIWPDRFNSEEGLALMQEYFDTFTKISGTDVKDWGTLVPLELSDWKS